MTQKKHTLTIGSVALRKGAELTKSGNVTIFHSREVEVVDGVPVTYQLTVWAKPAHAKTLGLFS